MDKPIQIVDLDALHLPIKAELDNAIQKVLHHQQFIQGPEVHQFQNDLGEYLSSHVIGVGNGTDALEIALLTLGIQPGDEVLVPSFSYYASAEVIVRIGAIPVFVDVNEYFHFDIADAEHKITSKTKALIGVHLYGMAMEMETLMQWANQHQLKVIEDNAQAIGASCVVNGKNLKVGTIGDLGCISFFPSKNLGAFGDGGAIVSSNSELLQKAKMIAQHGQLKRYMHDLIGTNSRLDTIQAAVLSVKLSYLDSWNAKRIAIANRYNQAFGLVEWIQVPKIPKGSTHVYHQYTILVEGDRDEILENLKQLGIPGRLYYPQLIHKQKAFKNHKEISLPNSEFFQKQMISLPIHPEMTVEQVDYVIEMMQKAKRGDA